MRTWRGRSAPLLALAALPSILPLAAIWGINAAPIMKPGLDARKIKTEKKESQLLVLCCPRAGTRWRTFRTQRYSKVLLPEMTNQ